jgi:hypothetical protein
MIQQAWCILEPNGKWLAIYTIRWRRKDSISSFLNGSGMTWKECRKVGWQCIKINISR